MSFEFPNIPDGTRLCIDIETTSFDDKEQAFYPWRGHAIAGFAVATETESWYFPIRHHDGKGYLTEGNLDEAEVRRFIQYLLSDETREVFGHNFKFDLRFLLSEGYDIKCKVACTGSLARLVYNVDWLYNLDHLGEKYGAGRKLGDEVKRWLSAAKTEDFGRLPVRLASKYARNDAAVTYRLMTILEEKLPEESWDLWHNEKTLTRILADAEVRGVCVNRRKIRIDRLAVLEKMQEIKQKISLIAEWDVDPNSRDDRTELLVNQLGFEPQEFTAKHQPKWTRGVMEKLILPDEAGPEAKQIGGLFRDWAFLSHFEATYLNGWDLRIDDNGRVHCDWRQYGTKTGRFSASDPNLQSVSKPATRYIVIPEGMVLVGFDYSQIEYRLFAHYTGDPTIADAYRNNPDADFHAETAQMLGVPRAFGKTLNFAVLYGMGEKKMIATIIYVIKNSPTQAEIDADPKMHKGATSREDIVSKINVLAASQNRVVKTMQDAAQVVLTAYHGRIPSIRRFSRKAIGVAKTRRWLRNLWGRRYHFDQFESGKSKGLHMTTNYLIQGSAADLLRYKIVEADAVAKKHGAEFAMTVHDSVYFYVPRESAPAFYVELAATLEDVPRVNIPIRVEGTVATRTMAAYAEPEECTEEAVAAAIALADTLDDADKSALAQIGKHIASARGL